MNRLRINTKWLNQVPWCVIFNLILLYICYMICRLVFVLENIDIFGSELHWSAVWMMLKGSLMFDSSAIFYTNIPYLLLVLLPLHYKETKVMRVITKWVFIVINSIFLMTNLVDCVYYAFSEKRATVLLFDEFSGNTNKGEIIGIELINHWYFVILLALMIFCLCKLYRNADYNVSRGHLKAYYLRQTICLLLFTFISIAGIRGALFSTSSRPIAMSNAHQYVKKPNQAAIVLNTPFSIIRTATKRQASVPQFYQDPHSISQYYSAVHMPNDSILPRKKNVVIMILESFAEEFVGARNRDLDGGTYRGYTTFIDSLLEHSTTFEHTYSNGWLSVDAMPSILSSIPKMYTSFILTPYALDDIPGLAKELKTWGYKTAFFHGAENSSMGFQAFSRSAGFDEYFGRTEYDDDDRFGGEKDFDGTWAIWDEEFLQFMCAQLDSMPEPFLASVFTASSHHPFNIPERYKEKYPEEGTYPIHKCIRYSDNALRRFFDEAKKQPWFENTIFVLTADHASSRITHDIYRTAVGDFRVPILFYDPSGELAPGTRPGIAQQIDIMPTVLSYLGYDKPFVAFGKDMLTTDANKTWAFNWHNIPQYIKGDYLLQYNDFKISAIYNLHNDPLLNDNLVGTTRYDKQFVDQMANELQAILQDADMRMREDRLQPEQ